MSNIFEKGSFSNGMFEENSEAESLIEKKVSEINKDNFDKSNIRDLIKSKLEGKTPEEKRVILEKMAENLSDDLARLLRDKEKEASNDKKAA